MRDLIYRQVAIDALERKKDKNAKGDISGFYNKIIQNDIDALMQLPSAEPRAITPDEFRDKMIEIRERDDSDTEMGHIYMDKFMCETLKLLGYGEGVEVFEKQDKWYS